MTRPATLAVVGTGIACFGQMTPLSLSYMETADVLLHLVTSSMTERWLRELNPTATTLSDCYREGGRRDEAYERMVQRILGHMAPGRLVCVALYGHPGVFVAPSHEAIRRARAAGHRAFMLPAISAEDCLFADLGVDPAVAGCQSYEATDFLLRGRLFDPTAGLVLWQIGAIGDPSYNRSTGDPERLAVLVEVLRRSYPANHPVVVYEAALHPLEEPRTESLPLASLPEARVTACSTLYVSPMPPRPVDPRLHSRLGLRRDDSG